MVLPGNARTIAFEGRKSLLSFVQRRVHGAAEEVRCEEQPYRPWEVARVLFWIWYVPPGSMVFVTVRRAPAGVHGSRLCRNAADSWSLLVRRSMCRSKRAGVKFRGSPYGRPGAREVEVKVPAAWSKPVFGTLQLELHAKARLPQSRPLANPLAKRVPLSC